MWLLGREAGGGLEFYSKIYIYIGSVAQRTPENQFEWVKRFLDDMPTPQNDHGTLLEVHFTHRPPLTRLRQ
jgi:hypothetical protein